MSVEVPDRCRSEFFHDPAAPRATVVVPVVHAVLRDPHGRLLLVRRADTGDWELPGGRVDPGESAAAALRREVAEESGLTVRVHGVAGLYTDPGHVVDDGTTVRQPFAVCLHATVESGVLRPDHRETGDARWFNPGEVAGLAMQPAVRLRVSETLGEPDVVHLR